MFLSLISEAYTIILKELNLWFEVFVKFLPNFLLALLVMFVFHQIAKFAKRISLRIFAKFSDSSTINSVLVQLLFITIELVGIFVALNVLDLSKAVTSLLAGAGVVGLALSFAFQDLATNFISGFFIVTQKPFVLGDLIKTNDYQGHVKEINLRTVMIEDLDGQDIILPSKMIIQNPLTNYSLVRKRRVNLTIGVDYGSDLGKVKEVTVKTIKQLSVVDTSKGGIIIDFNEFGGSSITFTLRFWIGRSEESDHNNAIAQAIMAITEAYRKSDINIPFPIRTLHMKPKQSDEKNN
ncbi:mechanosensitive ion channel family protein [Microscilla marina]|uniref:Putative mechanosensitive channel protein n=1 Tax=Microscilla marina ATCC 23134 TaxID=313606 RepID=A1ZQY5_MICM2|nr:mechanosensitive ion channel family protein [Microscilla marina]EAY27290.1 putative mechanosensitive channel protein [Microscilla marina ATCC 23134]